MAFRLSQLHTVSAPKVQLPDGQHRVTISFGTIQNKDGEYFDTIDLCPCEHGYYTQRIVLNNEKTFEINSANISRQLGIDAEMDIQDWFMAVEGKEIDCWIVTTEPNEQGKIYHNAYLYPVSTAPELDPDLQLM